MRVLLTVFSMRMHLYPHHHLSKMNFIQTDPYIYGYTVQMVTPLHAMHDADPGE